MVAGKQYVQRWLILKDCVCNNVHKIPVFPSVVVLKIREEIQVRLSQEYSSKNKLKNVLKKKGRRRETKGCFSRFLRRKISSGEDVY